MGGDEWDYGDCLDQQTRDKKTFKDTGTRRKGQREENKMRNTFGSKKWVQISLIGVCLGVFLLLAGDVQAGKVTYVYDALNRLRRAVYDQATFAYSYDKAGNRLTKTVTPTKPFGTIDFDGDGKNDIAFFRSGTGARHIIPSSTGISYAVTWGITGDIPVAGDYDGDGKTDLAIFRGSDGGWYIVPSGGGAPYGVGWGTATDKLVLSGVFKSPRSIQNLLQSLATGITTPFV